MTEFVERVKNYTCLIKDSGHLVVLSELKCIKSNVSFVMDKKIVQDLLLHKRHSDKIIVLGGQALTDYKRLGLFHVGYSAAYAQGMHGNNWERPNNKEIHNLY